VPLPSFETPPAAAPQDEGCGFEGLQSGGLRRLYVCGFKLHIELYVIGPGLSFELKEMGS
jgi:hypothetical protein